MLNNINSQKPSTKNQIKSNRPDIIKNANVLQGYLANSFNGGMIKPIAYAPVMAGTKIMDYRIRGNLKMLTPKTVSFQKLKACIKCYFVPNSRVWENAEKFTAQKGGMTEIKIEEIPNLGGANMKLAYAPYDDPDVPPQIECVPLTDTDIFRDSYLSTYLPRYQTGAISSRNYFILPKYSVLAIRGFRAIYNDYERNKEYDQPLIEFKTDTCDLVEQYTYLDEPLVSPYLNRNILRGKRQNSYYTDYRTELLGENTEFPDVATSNANKQPMLELTEWEKYVAEYRAESENAQLNDWDIIAKIRGSKKLTQGKVQLLGSQTIALNYEPVTQSTYNENQNIQEEYQVLGQQGGYSYTEFDVSLCQMQEIIEEGYLHVIIQVTADSVFETGFERTGLNVSAMSQYRPDLKDLKEDVLYEIEKCGTRISNADDLTKVTGFKRKFNEYFKAPNCINGDITNRRYYKTDVSRDNAMLTQELTQIENQRTHTFFEQDDKETKEFYPKNIWQDYTDILINENLAIEQEVSNIRQDDNTQFLWVRGQNQLFMLGMQTLVADMPIDENIKNNYKTWGEK